MGNRLNIKVRRRDFLKAAAPAAVGMLAYRAENGIPAFAEAAPEAAARPASAPVLSGVNYKPRAYPIQPKAFTEVTLKDDFWKPKMEMNAEVTIPFELQKFEEREKPVSYNVLQAAIYSLQTHPDPQVQAKVDASVQQIKAAYQAGEQQAGSRVRNDLFEVAAAYYVATGKRDLLDIAVQSGDSLYRTYKTTNPPFSGGERDAINCIQLYTATNDRKYLDLAKHYLDIRGLPNSVNRGRHNQSYEPVLEQSEAVGHAVNDASLMVSLVDVGTLTGLHEYFDTAHRIWLDTVTTKVYITGGIGSSGNEGFLGPYDLPNLSAYSETCAVIMYSTFNHKMFLATGDGKYIDVMERSIYNNLVDGVSASGNHFFYVNRLASAGDGRDVRWERASLECCPPNLVRFMASMPGYIYAQAQDAIYVNLYVSSDAAFKVDGKEIALSVTSGMPWDGKSQITVAPASDDTKANLKLRIPGWAKSQPVPSDLYSYLDKVTGDVKIAVNGTPVAATADKSGYVSIERNWKHGDVVSIEFPLEVSRIVTNPKVRDNKGRVALSRGPVVYCAEWPDYQGGQVLTALIDAKAEFTPGFDKQFYGGVTLLHGQAKSISMPMSESRPIKLIPYYLWANRGPGEMAVWLSKDEYAIGNMGPAGGLIFYTNPHYAADGWRYLEVAPRDQSAGAKWGSFRTPIPGAYGTAIGTGKQNTADMEAGGTAPGTAAHLCTSYSLNGFRDWFLPSIDELLLIYTNLHVTKLANFGDAGVVDNYNYWSSSQATTDMARHCDFADNGVRHYDDKDYPRRVRAIRAF